jgi:hypothetical protein
MSETRDGGAGGLATSGWDGDWSYLRANLDSPRHRLTQRLSSGLASWILNNWRPFSAPPARLAMIARVTLGPRQALSLVEADGAQVLVATSGDGPASFLPLHPAPAPSESCTSTEHLAPPLPGAVSSDAASSASELPIRDPELASSPGVARRLSRRVGAAGRVSW